MLESLICPNCSAPLKFSGEGGESLKCPYCDATVLLNGKRPQARRASENVRVGPSKADQRRGVIALLVIGVLLAVVIGIVIVANQKSPTSPLSSATPAKPQFANVTLQFGSKGITAGHFVSASRICVDQAGHVYVGEGRTGRVQLFDATGKYLSELSVGNFDDMVVDRGGTLYVLSGGNILRFNAATGEKLPDMERGVENYVGRQTPVYYRCACLTAGMVHALTGYAVDQPQFITLNCATGRIASTVDATTPAGVSPDMHDILVLTTGETYGLDPEQGIVFKFSSSGAYVNQFGGGGNDASPMDERPPSELLEPSCMTSDSQGRIYVGDGSGIKVYNKDGNYVDGFGDHQMPRGLAIDDQDTIYACYDECVKEFVLQKR